MSTAEVETPEIDEVIEEEIVAVSPARRALEVGAFVSALASLVLLAYFALLLYTAVKLQTDQGAARPSWDQILSYAGSQFSPYYTSVFLALVSIIVVAVARGIYSDQRSHDRTVASATIAMVVAVVNLFIYIYNGISILVHGDSQLGDSAQAKLTVMFGHVGGAILAIGVLAIGIIFITSRDDNDDLDNDDEELIEETEVVETPAVEAAEDEKKD